MSQPGPGMQRGFNPPFYGPGQSADLMQDPMAATMVMMGLPMLQQGLGAGRFLPHLLPTQALSDQFIGSRYQRETYAALQAASARGNAAVAERLLGLRAQITDAPTTPLVREQASNIAGFINMPAVKTMLGSVFGPENLEALMFGRRGDPAALVQAASRVGFFRKDAMGGRMDGAAASAFAENIYENMYGDGADIDALHGFMAGQTGQLMQDMMQRGKLAQSIGNLTPAERVRAVSSGQRDAATRRRLAEQLGRQELEKEESYLSDTPEGQKAKLAARLPEFESKINETFTEIDRFQAADPRAKNIQDIEKMAGYGVAARNVDTQKISKALQERLGAVDAVREIFGDQGVDAPFSALVEALDSLSGGAVDRVDSAAVEKSLRSMRLGIRDAGLSLEAVGQLGARGEAVAQMYGISDQGKMAMNQQTIHMLAAMRSAGAYDRNIFGQMTPGEAQEELQDRAARFRKSESAATLGSINRAYEARPDLYKGTRLEAAYTAANKQGGDGTYEFDGKKYNIFDDIVNYRKAAGQQLFQEAGSSAQVFNAFAFDPATEQNVRGEQGFALQRREVIKDIGRYVMTGQIRGNMLRESVTNLKPSNKTDAQFEGDLRALSGGMGADLAAALINETSGMTEEKSANYLEEKHKGFMQQRLVDLGYDPPTAAVLADSLSTAAFGDTEGRRQETFSAMRANANFFYHRVTGRHLTAQNQIGPEVEQAAAVKQAEYDEATRKEAEISKGRETSFLQRAGEVLAKSVDNPDYSRAQKFEDLFNVMSAEGFEFSAENRKQLEAELNATLDLAESDPNFTAEEQTREIYRNARSLARRTGAPAQLTLPASLVTLADAAGFVPAEARADVSAHERAAGASVKDAPQRGPVQGPPPPPASPAAVQQSVGAAQAAANPQQASGPPGKAGEVKINGTLRLENLYEGVMAALGDRGMDTPGGGAPVMGAQNNRATK